MEKDQEKNGKQIQVQDAGVIAIRYLKEIVQYVADIRVEEVTTNDDGSRWFITLGYRSTLGMSWETQYKVLTIDASTGNVISMIMRRAG